MFNKIKEFFTGSKPAVETTTQEVPLTAADVAFATAGVTAGVSSLLAVTDSVVSLMFLIAASAVVNGTS